MYNINRNKNKYKLTLLYIYSTRVRITMKIIVKTKLRKPKKYFDYLTRILGHRVLYTNQFRKPINIMEPLVCLLCNCIYFVNLYRTQLYRFRFKFNYFTGCTTDVFPSETTGGIKRGISAITCRYSSGKRFIFLYVFNSVQTAKNRVYKLTV